MDQLSQLKGERAAQNNIRFIGFGVALGIAITLATAANYVSREGTHKPSKVAQKTSDPIQSDIIDEDVNVETKAPKEPENKNAVMEVRAISEGIDVLCGEFLHGMLMYNKKKNSVHVSQEDASVIQAGERAGAQLQADLETLEAWKAELASDDPLQTEIQNCLATLEAFLIKNKPTIDEYRDRNKP